MGKYKERDPVVDAWKYDGVNEAMIISEVTATHARVVGPLFQIRDGLTDPWVDVTVGNWVLKGRLDSVTQLSESDFIAVYKNEEYRGF